MGNQNAPDHKFPFASKPKPEPKETFIDYNPDHRPSDNRSWIDDRDGHAYEVLHVRDLGALVFRTNLDVTECGVSTFTDAEIGWRQ